MLQGLMMNTPLVITSIMRFAERNFPGSRIVTVSADGTRTCSYADAFRRTRRLAHGLGELGIRPGDRVATLAWNDYRHFEIYYALSCYGAVCHTVNPRLFPDQIAYIIDHAEDAWIFADPMFAPLLSAIWPRLRSPRGVTFLTDSGGMPDTSVPASSDYESLLAGQSDRFEWPELDERTASGVSVRARKLSICSITSSGKDSAARKRSMI